MEIRRIIEHRVRDAGRDINVAAAVNAAVASGDPSEPAAASTDQQVVIVQSTATRATEPRSAGSTNGKEQE